MTKQFRPPDPGLDPLFNLLNRLRAENFYGSLELKWQAGGIQQILKHESLKMNALETKSVQPDNRTSDDSRFNR